MRLWVSSGNDLCSAIDIKEGIEYASGVKNVKDGVAEIQFDNGIGREVKQNK